MLATVSVSAQQCEWHFVEYVVVLLHFGYEMYHQIDIQAARAFQRMADVIRRQFDWLRFPSEAPNGQNRRQINNPMV